MTAVHSAMRARFVLAVRCAWTSSRRAAKPPSSLPGSQVYAVTVASRTPATTPARGRGRRHGVAPEHRFTLLIRYIPAMGKLPQPGGFAREASYIADIAQLSDRDIARATGAGESTVRAWRAGQRNPSGERAERLAELSSLVERLVRVMDAGHIAVWLRKPVPSLADEKPVDLIARGEYRRVSQVIAALEGMPVS